MKRIYIFEIPCSKSTSAKEWGAGCRHWLMCETKKTFTVLCNSSYRGIEIDDYDKDRYSFKTVRKAQTL